MSASPSSFMWVNDSGSRAQDHQQQLAALASEQESLLLAITETCDIYLYTVNHRPQQEQEKGETVVEKSLHIQRVAAIESREIVSVLKSNQLGESSECHGGYFCCLGKYNDLFLVWSSSYSPSTK